ncbi:hypothetical protein FRC16_005019 [Serendipita sp. 398]|nr:hypothetical protein FRC16_005019 [Serendipita sp. 398]
MNRWRAVVSRDSNYSIGMLDSSRRRQPGNVSSSRACGHPPHTKRCTIRRRIVISQSNVMPQFSSWYCLKSNLYPVTYGTRRFGSRRSRNSSTALTRIKLNEPSEVGRSLVGRSKKVAVHLLLLYTTQLLFVVGKEPLVRRIVHGTTVEEVFEQDLQMMVWMPEDFVVFAREMVAQVAKKCDMEPQNNFINEFWRLPNVKKKHSDRVLYEVKIDTMVMWQQVDRRLDEIFELIWSFMFSNDRMQMEEDARFCLLELQISRRALRSKAENEFLDFALWVARDPGPIAGEDYGGMSRGFWGHALYDAEDPYEGEYVDEDEDDEYDHFLESRMYDRWVGYMLGGGLMGFGGFKMGWDGNDDDDDEYGDDAHGEEH